VEGRDRPSRQKAAMTAPELSVIVTTFNRRELLRTCLASFEQQTAAGRFDVVAVVDGSTDGTEEMLARLEPSYPLAVVAQPQAGQSAARNAGAARAKAPILLFVDDDEVASRSLVEAHLAAHAKQEGVAAFGVIHREVPADADRLARLRADDARAHNEELATRPLTFLEAYGGNSSVLHSTFDAVGGYGEDFPRETDFEFGYRLHEAGVPFVFVPEAAVTEYRTRPWRKILEDVELRGRVSIDLYRRHPAILPTMELGGKGIWPRWWLAVRTVLLRLRLPPGLLGRIGLFLPQSWMRSWFGYVWNYTYWRGATAAMDPELQKRSKRGTLILRYHAFGADGEKPSRYVVPGRRLERQLRWLERRGYAVLSLGEYLAHRREFTFPPAKSVVLTFDDGYEDNFTVARPILDRAGCPATVFLITAADGRNEGATDSELVGRPVVGPERAQALRGEQVGIGAHTRTHPDLTALDPDAVRVEVNGSRADLAAATGAPPDAFAYPFGESNAEVRDIVREAGFEAACGITSGHNRPATDSFDLRRVEVRGTDSLLRFAATLIVGATRSR
jgi:peptidoglycan/xylan/chitin deacetylase (PgdA/CDA1 family)/glycosyltransferase involved in cell wall biosynthesis